MIDTLGSHNQHFTHKKKNTKKPIATPPGVYSAAPQPLDSYSGRLLERLTPCWSPTTPLPPITL